MFRVLFAGLGLLTLVVLASVVTELAAIDVRKKLDNALRLERDLGQLLTTLQDAEIGQRSFLLTKDSSDLQPYTYARDTIGSILARIGMEVLADPIQQIRVERVRSLTRYRFGDLSRSINSRAIGDTAAVDRIIQNGGGREIMTKIRNTIVLLRQTENNDVARRQQQLSRLSQVTTALRLLGVVGLAFVLYYIYTHVHPLYGEISQAHDKAREANRRLSAANQELSTKNRELDQFAYIASHDLREPLRTVSNFVEVINEDHAHQLDEEGKSHLSFISRATQRMSALIDSLLQYSRVGRSELPGRVNLNRVLDEVRENLSLRIEESGAVLTSDRLPVITGYAVALRQLLQNLIANALKFHKPGEPPRIRVEGSEEADVYRITVRDEGIGMSACDQTKIFDLFTRLHGADSHDGQGIGLAFCQKIVQLHRGTIEVKSEPGQGSTFTVRIPRTIDYEKAGEHTAD
ncbi:signal transduction histidine kinase [Lewinella aquimaris]|uniref:histidine kinase n=1 Tax=Neolewinella aquimaris TaxID=1835722 RepID=A0A840EJK1_9BACT|nr:sensor histidine kinase [Neolewinella aquimaris]MBB4081056.1 signal transduction histidine kinase [Neolewinella aquimaris]